MMKLSIDLHTVQNLGDHGREITVPLEHIAGETVEQLINRARGEHGTYTGIGNPKILGTGDTLVIRVIDYQD